MWSQRSVVDYSLARRATLRELFSGRASTTELCDADPYLQRAARYHGEPAPGDCPVCRRERLTHVTYAYGDSLKHANGRAWPSVQLPVLARQHEEFSVFVVEVCRGCGWNHLVTSYVLGTGRRQPARRARSRSSQS